MTKKKKTKKKDQKRVKRTKEFGGYFLCQNHGFMSIHIFLMVNGLLLHHLRITAHCSPPEQQASRGEKSDNKQTNSYPTRWISVP